MDGLASTAIVSAPTALAVSYASIVSTPPLLPTDSPVGSPYAITAAATNAPPPPTASFNEKLRFVKFQLGIAPDEPVAAAIAVANQRMSLSLVQQVDLTEQLERLIRSMS